LLISAARVIHFRANYRPALSIPIGIHIAHVEQQSRSVRHRAPMTRWWLSTFESFVRGRVPAAGGLAAGYVAVGIDALIIVLAARYGEIFWIFPPILATASLVGASLVYWIGQSAGYVGLPRLVPRHHLERIKSRLDKTGALALAAAAVMPPPFPLTPFVLTCGALQFDRAQFFLVFGVMRLIRFATVGLLARYYGDGVLQVLKSESLHTAVVVLVLVVGTASIASVVLLWRRTRLQPV
jgi:membrane protein DedA with SNARE-associated domain